MDRISIGVTLVFEPFSYGEKMDILYYVVFL